MSTDPVSSQPQRAARAPAADRGAASTAESVDSRQPETVGTTTARLSGNMGTFQLVFLVLAFAAPLSGIAGIVPVGIAYGGGVATPLILIAIGLIMALFAVGYLVMARKLPRAGALYTFVTAGLGRPLGLSASFVAIVTYSVGMAAVIAFAGISLEVLVPALGGPALAWWIWCLILVPIVGVLGYVRVDFSAKVMGVLLVIGSIVVLVYDGVVLFGTQGADAAEVAASFNPANLLGGGAIVAFALTVSAFAGFESTAIYADEVRNPRKTIPRATYLSIAIIGVLYTVSSLAVLHAFGGGETGVAAIAVSPASAFLDSIGQYLGVVAFHITGLLVVLSLFGGFLACHNIVARYMFNLGVDRILPPSLGVAHPRFGSPSRASLVLTVITFVFFALAAFAPSATLLYTVLIGLGGLGLIVLLLLAAIAITVYLLKTRPSDVSLWERAIAPTASAILMTVVLVAVVSNLDLITGGGVMSILAVATPGAAIVLGVVVGLVVKARRPDIYRSVGTRE